MCFVDQRVGLFLRDHALADQLALRTARARSGDPRRSDRSRGCVNAGSSPFVVSVAAIADEIDQRIELEAVTIGPRQPRRLDARHRIVRVDVHDRES